MRYRDQPTIEVTQRVNCDVATAWSYVSDITVPARCSAELQSAEWLNGARGVDVGARFRGRNRNDAVGEWETVCEVTEVEATGDHRRWVWNVLGREMPVATWGFEVEPADGGVVIRQWARMGPGPSGLTPIIAAQPDREARIIARRLASWQSSMAANLEWIRARAEA